MIITPAQEIHIDSMVNLSHLKRKAYEIAQPKFWKYAGPKAEEEQMKWFKELIGRDDYIALVLSNKSHISAHIEGFIIGRIMKAPAVYNPGGHTLMIDDFCVKNQQWENIGRLLLERIKALALQKNVTQLVIVSGAHDFEKKKFLEKNNLNVASEWFVGNISIN